MKMKKEQRGITLIALIITVIVLLILAGTAISIAINGGDLFSKTAEARASWNGAVAEENTVTNNWIEQINSYSNSSTPQANGVTIPEELSTKIANNEDLTGITITLPTISGYYKWDKEYCANVDTKNDEYYDEENDTWVPFEISLDISLYTGTTPEGITAYTTGSISKTTNYDMTINGWKILRVNDDDTIDLVPSYQTIPDVPLEGAQGYNNGVNMLNAACSALYGDASKGITARSIKIEDIEEFADSTALATAKNRVGQQAQNANSADSSKYPTIYAEENGAVINGANPVTNGLGQSDIRSAGLISRSQSTVENAESIQQIWTAYDSGGYYHAIEMNSNVFGNYSNILSPAIEASKMYGVNSYWIATRAVDTSDFYILACDGESYDGVELSYAGITRGAGIYECDGTDRLYWYSLCPVVTLNSGSLTGSGNTYTFVPAN